MVSADHYWPLWAHPKIIMVMYVCKMSKLLHMYVHIRMHVHTHICSYIHHSMAYVGKYVPTLRLEGP